MSGQELAVQLKITEELISSLNEFIGDIGEFQNRVSSSIDALDREGLPREMVKTYKAKHLDKIKRYTSGIEKYLRTDTLKYAQVMKMEITEGIEVALRG